MIKVMNDLNIQNINSRQMRIDTYKSVKSKLEEYRKHCKKDILSSSITYPKGKELSKRA